MVLGALLAARLRPDATVRRVATDEGGASRRGWMGGDGANILPGDGRPAAVEARGAASPLHMWPNLAMSQA
eukprot:COSAG05_NODE_1230_length_5443_cov_6.168600_4_plen_71_part_00